MTFALLVATQTLFAAICLLFGAKYARPIRWFFHCRRGRRCSKAEIMRVADEWGAPPEPGFVAGVDYICDGCGTPYRQTVLFGEDGSFAAAERVRLGS